MKSNQVDSLFETTKVMRVGVLEVRVIPDDRNDDDGEGIDQSYVLPLPNWLRSLWGKKIQRLTKKDWSRRLRVIVVHGLANHREFGKREKRLVR